MVMKIENYSGSLDTFTFPYNPIAFDDTTDKVIEETNVPYGFNIYGTAAPQTSTRSIVISGHFSDTDKTTNYQALSKHVNSNKLKKLYFSTDKFYIVVPQQVKKTNAGGRTNFIDYVASFKSPFGILFSDAQKNGVYTSAEDNEGNVTTLIEKIITTGVTATTTYTYLDKNSNGFKFKATATGTATIYLIYQYELGSDVLMSETYYCLVGTTKQSIARATSNKKSYFELDAAETLNTRFNTGSAAIPANTTFYFRHGYSGE